MKNLPILLLSGVCLLAAPGEVLAQKDKNTNQLAGTHKQMLAGNATNTGSGSATTLLRFEVRYSPVQRHTFVTWQTLTEPNNHRFEVERSDNGVSFQKIGQRPADPQSRQVKNYKFTDTAPLAGRNFYRLKQISLDSSVTYSRVVSATTRRITQTIIAELTPNPCPSGNCDVRIGNVPTGTPVVVELLDENGRLLSSRKMTDTETPLPLSQNQSAFRKGTYYLRVSTPDETKVQRVLIQ